MSFLHSSHGLAEEPNRVTVVTAAQESRSLPAWSPSALYMATVVEIRGAAKGRMVVMERRPNSERMATAPLGEDTVSIRPIWTGDGQTVYWISDQGVLGMLRRDGSSAYIPLELPTAPQTMIFSRDGTSLVILAGGGVRAVPIEPGSEFRWVSLGSLAEGVQWIDRTSNGNWVAAVHDGAAWVARDWSGPWHLAVNSPDAGAVSWARLSPDGRKLALGAGTATLLADLASGMMDRLATAGVGPEDLAWSSDSRYLAVAGEGLRVYDADGRLLGTLASGRTRWPDWAARSSGPSLAFCQQMEGPSDEAPSWSLQVAKWPPQE